MKRRISIIALMTTMACETEDPGLQFNAFKSIEDECEFLAGANPDLLSITFDPEAFGSLRLFGELQSRVAPQPVVLDMIDMENLPANLSINVTEFEYAFECDLSGFAGPRELFLPGQSLIPFCRDPRDPDGEFSGFDLVPVAGTLNNAEASAIATRVVSPSLANDLEDLFTLSVSAFDCCVGTPEGMACDIQAGTPACQDVASAVDNGEILADQVDNFVGYREAVQLALGDANFAGPLLLNVRGNYRGITNRGNSLVSNEANLGIEVCSGCIDNEIQSLRARVMAGETEAEEPLEEIRTFINCFE